MSSNKKMKQASANFSAIMIIFIFGFNGVISSNLDVYNQIFTNYNRHIRPFSTVNQTVPVEVLFSLIMISEVNEQKQTLTFRGTFSLGWTDDQIKKNINVSSDGLLCNPNDIWTPDLGILNSATTFNVITSSNAKAVILSQGRVRWSPEGLFTTTCEISPLLYPFDTQTCDISISAWFSNVYFQTLVLQHIDGTFLQKTAETLHTHTEWDLTDANQVCYNSSGVNPYLVFTHCKFTIQLTRRSQYFVTHLILPLIVMSLITPFVFLLTESSGERVSYGVTLFLSYSVFMQSVTEDLPVTSLEVSYFTVLVQWMFVLSGIQVVIVCVLVRIRDSNLSEIIPKLTCRFRRNKNRVAMHDQSVGKSTEELKEANHSNEHNSDDVYEHDDIDKVCWFWTYIDYVMFGFFFTLTFGSIIIFIAKTRG